MQVHAVKRSSSQDRGAIIEGRSKNMILRDVCVCVKHGVSVWKTPGAQIQASCSKVRRFSVFFVCDSKVFEFELEKRQLQCCTSGQLNMRANLSAHGIKMYM